MLQINHVRVELKETEYQTKIAQVLNLSKKKIWNVQLVKQAVDARRKNKIHFICSFQFETENEDFVIASNKKQQIIKVQPYNYPVGTPTTKKIVIVGSGPAGLFCAYQLARSNQSVILLERGKDIQARNKDVEHFFSTGVLNEESNIQFGAGGAGTFSDGKLTTGVKDKRKQFVLETMVQHGATKDILYRNKPHVGSDYLGQVVTSMLQYIEDHQGTVRYNTKLVDLHKEDESIQSIVVESNGVQETIDTDCLVLAIGHSSRDTYRMLHKNGLVMEQKPFAVGLRIEHLQSFINESQYGKCATNPRLPVADYKLAVHPSTKRGVYSFCMCPGGEVVNASSHKDQVVVNGMSNHDRSLTNSNSAIIVTVDGNDFGSDEVLAGIDYQEMLEKKAFELGGSDYSIPVQRVEDFLENTTSMEIEEVVPSVKPKTTYCNLQQLFSQDVNNSLIEGLQLMNEKIPGFTSHAILSGVETRSSAPVRLVRNEGMMASIKGVYPIGEGAGYAGGIMSSAIDGLKCAQIILQGE